MNTINMILQGKGGVGKTLVSSIIAQYKAKNGTLPRCIDTDPVNATFTEYKLLETQPLDIVDDDNKIDEGKFDQLMEMLLTEDIDFVVDNGASTFVPLTAYLAENNAIELLVDAEKTVNIHVVVTGGQAMSDTLTGLAKMLETMPRQANIVVWLNEYFGPVELQGKNFEEMKVYSENKEIIRGIIRIPKKTQATFGRDVEMMLKEKLTFDQAIHSEKFNLMSKSRLSIMKKSLFSQMDNVMEL